MINVDYLIIPRCSNGGKIRIPKIQYDAIHIYFYFPRYVKGPIIYLFDDRPLRKHKIEFLHLAGALMEHFLGGIDVH